MLEVGGIDLAHTETGAGPAVLGIHETATCGEIWRPLAEALGGRRRLISYDRRGWGASGSPHPYTRTTIEEQSEEAAGVLASLGLEAATVVGAGLGAVAALDLMLRRPAMVSAAILIEPPLFAFVPEATEGLSADRLAIEEAIRGGGSDAAMDLYLAGGLAYLGAGAERIPAEVSEAARARPGALFAELGAVPAWSLQPAALRAAETPSRVVLSTSTPPPLRAAAAGLCERLSRSQALEIEGDGLPHASAAPALADLISGHGDGWISTT